ncbi:Malate synthase [Eumeta japonica]|uniref:malate synthase n=1 Tax=Eumeta variegata TaxID=151549 RepID=A0A4C1VR95_EUMVA|nr:Malate synthase [Eumeta japonica]
MINRIGPVSKKLTTDKKLKRGEWDEKVRNDEEVIVLKWKDTKAVTVLSTCTSDNFGLLQYRLNLATAMAKYDGGTVNPIYSHSNSRSGADINNRESPSTSRKHNVPLKKHRLVVTQPRPDHELASTSSWSRSSERTVHQKRLEHLMQISETLALHCETDTNAQEQQYENYEDETEEDEENAPNIADSRTSVTKLRSISGKIKRNPRHKAQTFDLTIWGKQIETESLRKFNELYEEYRSLHSLNKSLESPRNENKVCDEDEDVIDFEKLYECSSTSSGFCFQGLVIDELEEHLRKPRAASSKDILEWWRTHATEYPVLSQMARDFLSIPTTSVPAERLFSKASLVIAKLARLLLQNQDQEWERNTKIKTKTRCTGARPRLAKSRLVLALGNTTVNLSSGCITFPTDFCHFTESKTKLIEIQNKKADELMTFKLIDSITNQDDVINYPKKFISLLELPRLPSHYLQLNLDRCRHLDLGDVSASNVAHFISALNADVQGVQIDGKEAIGPLVDFAILMYHNAEKLHETRSGPYFYLSKLESASEAALWDKIFVWAQNELGLPQGTIKACVLIENILSTFELEEILYALRNHSMGLNCGIWDYAASLIAKFGHRPEFLLPDRNKYVNMERHFLKSYLQLVVKTCHARGAPATGGMAAAVIAPGTDATDKGSKETINKVLEAKRKEIEVGVDGFLVYDSRIVPHLNEASFCDAIFIPLWKKYGATPNQLSRKLDLVITEADLLEIPSGGVTLNGLRHNVAVAILFIYHWLAGIGHFFYSGNVEDSATAEISRFQIWQWIRFAQPPTLAALGWRLSGPSLYERIVGECPNLMVSHIPVCFDHTARSNTVIVVHNDERATITRFVIEPPLEDDPKQCVTIKLVEKTVTNFCAHAFKNLCRSNAERKRLTAARYMATEVFLAREPPEFITTYLNDNHKFRTLHNKAMHKSSL